MGWVEDRRGELAEQLDARGDLAPPWAAMPELGRYAIGWRMGEGEAWVVLWDLFLKGLDTDRDTRLEYLRRHAPVPFSWAENAYGVLVPRGLAYGNIDRSEPAAIKALQALGLLASDACYTWWLRRQRDITWPWLGGHDPVAETKQNTRRFWYWSRRMSALRDELTDPKQASDSAWLEGIAAAWQGGEAAEAQGVPEAWVPLLAVMRAGVLPRALELDRGLWTLATMMCAGEVLPPWKLGLTIDDAQQAFGDDMGFADAFCLWVMSAFDDVHGLEAYLQSHAAPEAWVDQLTPMFDGWRAPNP
jgi:hypothetical protein